MKIYTNLNHEIIAIKEAPAHYSYEYDINRDEAFGGWCDACILGFKHEPAHETDSNGDFVLDENGDKIVLYYQTYIFANWRDMIAMNNLYEVEIVPMSKTIDQLLISTL